jgi:hypothetical protein
MTNGIVNPTPRLEARIRTGSGLYLVGPRDTWEMGSLLAELVEAPFSEPGIAKTVDIEIGGMFFGSAPGLSLSPARVNQLSERKANLTIAMRTTDVGVVGREPPVDARNSDRTSVSVSFRVSGLFEPDEFTERVGLRPTRATRRQDPRRLMARVSTWRLEAGPIVADDFSALATNELLAEVLPSAAAIKSAVRETGTRSAIHFAGMYGDVVPKLTVARGQMTSIAQFECWLDYSLIVVRGSGDNLEF